MTLANDNKPVHVEFLTALFGETEKRLYFQSLANDSASDEGKIKPPLTTREIPSINGFVAKHDRSGRGLFFCVGTLKDGAATRNKDNISETIGWHTDLDFKSIAEPEPLIRERLSTLPCQPTVRVRSGGGLHCYWLFREPIDAQEYRDVIEDGLRRLADVLAGDPAVCEISRLMRLPGTHNSKYGDMREVILETVDGPRYELEDLEEWLAEQKPILTRKVAEPAPGRKAPPADDNPYLAHARQWGYKPRLDVDAALRDMSEGTIHVTLRNVSASLIQAGQPIEEVVGILMEAARGIGGPDWNWRAEEKKIRKLCESALKKFPPKEDPVSHETNTEKAEPPEGTIDLGAARAQRKANPKGPRALLAPFAVADGVIEVLRKAGRDIMLAEGEAWLYGDGFWRIRTPADEQWLLVEIQRGFEALGEPAKTSALSSCWKRLNEHPSLYKAVVPWAGGDTIVCQNGVLRATAGLFEGHKPENYARRHIGAAYLAGAECKRFEALLWSILGRMDLIDLVQEWLGAALVTGSLSREERRALILVGPSRTGKTELSRAFTLLFGSPVATPSVAAISDDRDRFALSSLYGAIAWVRDDAINEGDNLNPQRFKTVVTGEPIDVEQKHKDIVRNYCFEIPVCLTANSLPKAIDGSDAIFNRSLILRMENVIDEPTAARIRIDNDVPSNQRMCEAIFEAEASGILNWALKGLARLRKRGFYDIPDSVRDAISRFKDDNNPIGEWCRDAVIADPYSKVERRDLVRSFNGWQFEQEGSKAVGRGGRWLMPKLRNQVPGLGDFQSSTGARYVTGLKLSDVGLAMWKTYGEANPHGGAGGSASVVTEVNRVNERANSHVPSAGSTTDCPF